MPSFETPFAGMKSDRKLTDTELIRAIRFVISAEYEAIQLYTQLAESTDNENAIKVLKSVSDEEIIHAGEFQKLLITLSPEEKTLCDKGANEAEEMINSVTARIAKDLIAEEDPMAGEKLSSLFIKFHSWATKLATSRPPASPVVTQILDGMRTVEQNLKGKEHLTGKAAVEAIINAMKNDFTMEAQPIMYLAKKCGYTEIRQMFGHAY